MDEKVVRSLAAALDQGEPAELCLVVETRGSAPRKAGACLVLRADGSTAGTVGGGALERLVLEEAARCLARGASVARSFSLDGAGSVADASATGMICGGEAQVCLLHVDPQAAGGAVRALADAASARGGEAWLVVDLAQKDDLAAEVMVRGQCVGASGAGRERLEECPGARGRGGAEGSAPGGREAPRGQHMATGDGAPTVCGGRVADEDAYRGGQRSQSAWRQGDGLGFQEDGLRGGGHAAVEGARGTDVAAAADSLADRACASPAGDLVRYPLVLNVGERAAVERSRAEGWAGVMVAHDGFDAAAVTACARPALLGQVFALPVRAAGRAVVVGAGHVGAALVPVLAGLGFAVTVCDARPEVARAGNLPQAAQVLLCPFDQAVARAGVSAADYVVVCTPGHASDFEVLAQALAVRPRYLGCLGSRRKAAATREKLRAAGFSPEEVVAVHMPVGLAIGAETPEEIAISIAAEIIACRRSQGV